MYELLFYLSQQRTQSFIHVAERKINYVVNEMNGINLFDGAVNGLERAIAPLHFATSFNSLITFHELTSLNFFSLVNGNEM